MGSHHQFQDIQGLASQQPASADMVFLGFAGRGVARGLHSRTVLSCDGQKMARTRAIFVLLADVCAYVSKRGRRRGRAAGGARGFAPDLVALGLRAHSA